MKNWWKEVWAIAQCDWLRIKKRPLFLAFIMIWPFLLALMMGGIFSHKVITKMPIAVWDQDQSSLSRTLKRFLQSSRSLDIRYTPQSMEEIKSLIDAEEIVAAVIVPRGLQEDMKRGSAGPLTTIVSGANLVTANLAYAEIRTIVSTLSTGIKLKLLRKAGLSRDRALDAAMLVVPDITRLHNPGLNYLNYLAPGTWMAILHQLILLFASLLIVGKREEVISLHSGAILVGKALPLFFLSLFYFEIFYRLLFPLFGIEFKGYVALMFLTSLCFTLCTLSLGLLISTASPRPLDAVKGVLLIGSPAFILSGYSWPIFAMPFWIQPLAYMIPLTPFLRAFRKIYQQGGGFIHVVGDMGIMLLMSGIFFTLAYWILKRQLDKTQNIKGQMI